MFIRPLFHIFLFQNRPEFPVPPTVQLGWIIIAFNINRLDLQIGPLSSYRTRTTSINANLLFMPIDSPSTSMKFTSRNPSLVSFTNEVILKNHTKTNSIIHPNDLPTAATTPGIHLHIHVNHKSPLSPYVSAPK